MIITGSHTWKASSGSPRTTLSNRVTRSSLSGSFVPQVFRSDEIVPSEFGRSFAISLSSSWCPRNESQVSIRSIRYVDSRNKAWLKRDQGNGDRDLSFYKLFRREQIISRSGNSKNLICNSKHALDLLSFRYSVHRTPRLQIQRLNDQVNWKELVEPSRLSSDWLKISIWKTFCGDYCYQEHVRTNDSLYEEKEQFQQIIRYILAFHPVSRTEFLDGMYTFFSFPRNCDWLRRAIVKISFLNICTVRPTFLSFSFWLKEFFGHWSSLQGTIYRSDIGETMPSLFFYHLPPSKEILFLNYLRYSYKN